MAEPLTSSDIIRERMGFGVSPLASGETRRAYAEAGLSPLGTQERERFERGGAISPMASKAEKDAWVAAEVMAGRRPESDLPVAYGGMGERPKTPKTGFYIGGEETAYGRRMARMQQAWDEAQKQQIEQQRFAQQVDAEQRRLALTERNQMLQERQEARLQAAETKAQEEELKVSEQADFALNEVLGGFDPSGNTISGLDPDAPDYMQRRNDIIKRYPKALKDEAFKTAIATTDKSYLDRVNFDQQLQAQEESSGRIVERQVAAEERATERQRGIREEERMEQEERGLASQEREMDKAIRAERQRLIQFQNQKVKPKEDIQATQNKILDLRIEKAALRDLVFEDNNAYKKATEAGRTFPSGTIIYIGRTPVKVK
jgi:hypothetical protein